MPDNRILVVDDEPQLRSVLRSMLSVLGFAVADAESGESAIDRVRQEKFDLVLLDVNMPGIGGLATCRSIRKGSDVSIIMLTVRGRSQDKIDALNAGADGYVTKPFEVNELLARIRATLRRAPSTAGADSRPLSLDGLDINFHERQVRVNGAVAKLTPTETDLLHYLVRHPNTAIPHDTILQAVWGPDYGGEVEYLRVYVNQLRKKIEPDPSRPRFILTEPWLGYRFALPEDSGSEQNWKAATGSR
jgi:two-component system, OmpR family, KDP operon response regulator KdpE